MKRAAFVLALFASAPAEAGGWLPVTSGIATDIHGVAFAGGPGVAYAVGSSGRILKSTDGGATWTPQVSGTGNMLLAVDFPVDSQVGYVTGSGGTILKTTDGGVNWAAQVSGTTAALRAVQFPVDAATGYAVGDGGVVLKTINGGATWTTLVSGTTNALRGVDFPLDATTGYAVGDGGVILKTTNGGTSFGPLTSGIGSALLDVDFTTDGATGYAVGGVGVILKTVDSGATWIKGFLFPRFGSNRLYVSTNTKVWSIEDNSTSGAVVSGWPVSIPSPSILLQPPDTPHVLVGSGDGSLYQIDIASPGTPSSVELGLGNAAVGAPTLDLINSVVYVGTDAGIIYAVSYPLP